MEPTRIADLSIILAWTIFWLVWVVQWRAAKPTRERSTARRHFAHLVPTLAGGFLMVLDFQNANRVSRAAPLWALRTRKSSPRCRWRERPSRTAARTRLHRSRHSVRLVTSSSGPPVSARFRDRTRCL